MVVPAGMPPHAINQVRQIRTAEVPGTVTTPRKVVVSVNGEARHTDDSSNSAPNFAYTLKNAAGYKALGAQVNVEEGHTLEWTITNPGYLGDMGAADVLVDITTPNRLDPTD